MEKTEAIMLLAIDDKPDNLTTLSAVVRDALPQTRILTANNGPAGIELAVAEDPDVILLDIAMPGMDGFEVCRRLKADDRIKDIPVVFLTALKTDTASRVKGLDVGAEGFLAKPLETVELTAQIRTMTKIKAANRSQRKEKDHLEALVIERTWELRGTVKDLRKSQRIAHVGSWRLNVTTNQVVWTEELYNMYGFDPSLPPPPYTEHMKLYTPKSWERLSTALAHTRETGIPYTLELETIKKDGSNGWMWVHGEADVDSAGKTVGLWGAAQEITDRKQSEEALRESEQSFRTLSNSGMALIWTSGTDKLCNYFNSVWLEFTGRTLEEEMGNGWTEGVHPDDFQRCLDIYVGAFDRQEKFSMEYRLRRHDGEYRWIVDEGCPRYVSHGNFIGYIGHCLDITDRKLAEMNYQTLFNEMFDGFALHEIIVDDIGVPVNYRFLAVNPAFERITGLKAADIIGHTVFDIIPDTEMRWIETYGKVALTGDPVHLEDYSTTLQKHFEVTAYRPAPGQFACVIIDVTEKKKAAEEKQILQVQLQQAQKMEAIGTLAGGIAHDFNNILGAILGYAEMVQEDSPAGSRSRGDIDQVVKASHRAKELVKQILNFSRQAATEQIPLHPALIIKEVVKMLRSSLPSTIDLQQDVDSDVGLILADPTQIHQVLVNLCTNAFHAMEETGGILTISLKKTTLIKEDITSESQVQPGDFVQLSISDTGSGIAPEIQQKMFDPFFTTKEVGKGTGMGLAIIHGIAKSYKGFVNYNSKPGEGTVFHVYLPVIQDPALLEIEPVTFDLPQLGNERILFIDDEEILADVGKAMLERLGYRVTVRRNSIEALNTFQNQPDQFDLVITDQTMPGMTGSDLARRMLQIRPGMPIILCTGYSTVMSEEKACSLGIKGFAFKPLAKNDLAALIRKVLDGEKPTS